MLYCIVLHCTVLYCIALYCIVLHCIALHCIVLYCIVLYCIVLYCIVLYCVVLCCVVLYCIVLYCIVLYEVNSSPIFFKLQLSLNSDCFLALLNYSPQCCKLFELRNDQLRINVLCGEGFKFIAKYTFLISCFRSLPFT